MLHQNDYLSGALAGYRRQKLLAEAGNSEVQRSRHSKEWRFRERLLLSMADLLILSGKKLKGGCELNSSAQLSTR